MIRSRASRQKAHEILKMAGVREPPVDVRAIAGLLGFEVIPFEFPDRISGVTFIPLVRLIWGRR